MSAELAELVSAELAVLVLGLLAVLSVEELGLALEYPLVLPALPPAPDWASAVPAISTIAADSVMIFAFISLSIDSQIE